MSGTPRRPRVNAASDALLAKALRQMATPAMITDRRGGIAWTNRAMSSLTGYSSVELLGQPPSLLKSGKQDSAFYSDLWQTISAGQVWRKHIVDRRKDGTLFTADEVVTPLLDRRGLPHHYVSLLQDITDQEAARERERYLAFHDELTGLSNRPALYAMAQQAMLAAARARQALAILFVDLDGFKAVNDTLGHQAGDQLLITVAHRLQRVIRQSDLAARIGGDEFAVLITNLEGRADARRLALKLLAALAEPWMLQAPHGPIRASVGIALFPDDAADLPSLLSQADQAMYRAKRDGGQCYRFVRP